MSANDSHRGRKEPTLGDLDHIDAPERPSKAPGTPKAPQAPVPPAPPRRPTREPGGSEREPRSLRSRRSWVIAVALLALVVAATLAWVYQDQLRAMLPQTQMNALLQRADQALAQGHLESSDGTGARSLYEAARALEPDNERALQGLQNVGQAELQRARQALAQKHYAQAEQYLANARTLLGGGSEVDALGQKILHAQQSVGQTNAIIEQAQAQLAAGNLTGDTGAAALYRKALAVEPDNAVARHGLDKVGDIWAKQARQALASNDLETAESAVQRIAAIMPHYADLPSLRAAVTQARKQAEAVVQQHLSQAQKDLNAGKVAGSGDDNALAQFQAVLKADADNAQAQAGLGQVAQALIVQANAATDSGNYDQATQLLAQAAKLAPKSAELASAQSHLKSAQAQAVAAPSGSSAPEQEQQSTLSAGQKAKIEHLLERAQAAAKAGDIMAPPGACAYDLYRNALAIDPNNAKALSGLQSLVGRATTLFNQALKNGNLDRAGAMLDTLEQLDPGDTAQDGMRHRLASAYLDRAGQRVIDGQDSDALHDMEAARKLDPNSPRLQALSGKLGGSVGNKGNGKGNGKNGGNGN